MKKTAFILLALLATSSTAGIDEKFRAQREVALYYGFTDEPNAYAMILALWRFENGNLGNEAGHENKYRDIEVAANPCLSRDALNYGKSARAMVRFTLEWVLKDDWRRKEWAKAFAVWYHHSEEDDKNLKYSVELREIWREERAKIRAGIYEPSSTATR